MLCAFVVAFLLMGLTTTAEAQLDFGSGFTIPGASTAPGSTPGFGQQKQELVEITSLFTAATADKPAYVQITATIDPRYHIYATTQVGGPVATKITLGDSPDYRLAGDILSQPAPAVHFDSEIWDLDMHEHTGTVTWFVPVEISPSVDLNTLSINGKIELQACDPNSCVPINTTFSAKLQESAAVVPTEKAPVYKSFSASLLLLNLGSAFLGGLLLNLMPCVLPVIGLKILSFAEQGGQSRIRVLGLNIAYSLGLISVFMVLAALAAFAGFGWGQQFQSNGFRLSMVFLIFAMGLSFLGVWEIPIPGFAGTGKANDLQAKEGYSGAFFKGIFTTLLATPCSGPFLGPVLGWATNLPPALIFMIFFAVGLGMAMPYLLIGLFPSLVKWIPKPGNWMETFKQLMGFTLLAAVVYLMRGVGSELNQPTLSTLVAIGFGCWWIGSTSITVSPMARKKAWGVAFLVPLCVGLVTFLYVNKHELDWQPYNSDTFAEAQSLGKITLVDFSAEWCGTCQSNLFFAIDTKKVKQTVEANGIVPLLADWTDRSDFIKKKLNELGSNSIPLLAIYPANKPNEPIVLRDLISQSQLLRALEQAGATIPESSAAVQVVEPAIDFGAAAH